LRETENSGGTPLEAGAFALGVEERRDKTQAEVPLQKGMRKQFTESPPKKRKKTDPKEEIRE